MRGIEYLEEPTSQYSVLEAMKGDVLVAYEILRDCYAGGGKAMIAGNGGSCADSERIVGELTEGFTKYRPVSGEFAAALKKVDEGRGEELASCPQEGLPAIVFIDHVRLSTAFLSDVDGEMTYVQQLHGYRGKGNVFTGISTSDNAKNVMYVVVITKASDTKTVGLTGKNGGKMVGVCDCSIVVPSDETFKVQGLHFPIYHALCLMLEEHLYEV